MEKKLKTRLDLQAELEEILGSNQVYFSPPESIKLKYPCIVYKQSNIDTRKANNRLYLYNYRYEVTLIDRDPDSGAFKQKEKFEDEEASSLVERLLFHFPYCSHNRTFTTDNLNHNVFTIYY